MKVYVVSGHTGDDFDPNTWVAKVFLSERKAHSWVADADNMAAALLEKADGDCSKVRVSDHTLDPHFDISDSGTEYYIEEMDVEEL